MEDRAEEGLDRLSVGTLEGGAAPYGMGRGRGDAAAGRGRGNEGLQLAAWRFNAAYQQPNHPIEKNLSSQFDLAASQVPRAEGQLLGKRMADDAISEDPEA